MKKLFIALGIVAVIAGGGVYYVISNLDIIDRFTLEGAGASLTAPDFDDVREVTLPTITLRNIGRSENGATGREVARQLLQPVLEEALESAAVQALKDKASDKLDEVTDAVLEGIFGGEEKKEE
jgi:hypothetical protein